MGLDNDVQFLVVSKMRKHNHASPMKNKQIQREHTKHFNWCEKEHVGLDESFQMLGHLLSYGML